jgi:hypothetical protein
VYAPITAGAVRAVLTLFLITLALFGVSLLFTARAVNSVRQQARAECRFDADLGGAPVAASPATGKPSLLGVTIVSDARVAWRQLGCTGRLPAADPSFIKWARYYRLPAG